MIVSKTIFLLLQLPFYAKVSRPKKVLMHDGCMTSGSLNLIRALIGKVMIFFSGLGILEKMSSILFCLQLVVCAPIP